MILIFFFNSIKLCRFGCLYKKIKTRLTSKTSTLPPLAAVNATPTTASTATATIATTLISSQQHRRQLATPTSALPAARDPHSSLAGSRDAQNNPDGNRDSSHDAHSSTVGSSWRPQKHCRQLATPIAVSSAARDAHNSTADSPPSFLFATFVALLQSSAHSMLGFFC